MKVLLTGASSFSGYWFACTLAEMGHEVTAALNRPVSSYGDDVRGRRVRLLEQYSRIVENCAFGSEAFLELLASGPWDLLCHHAAHVQDYRSAAFDVATALRLNTMRLPEILESAGAIRAIVLTGSVFEQNEGAGNAPLRAFSPYGLSKGFTAEMFGYWCAESKMPLGKFVIPNPFGPFEEPRFCSYLVKTWKGGKTAEVRTPAYIRDNIPVDLLALCYAWFCEQMAAAPAARRCNPSCYAETQGAFTQRFASEIGNRMNMACPFTLTKQEDFPEPFARINTEPARLMASEWDEEKFWDALAEYYEKQ